MTPCLFRVLAAPAEKARRFNAEVADLLGVAVDGAESVLLLDLLVALLLGLPLLFAPRL